MGDPSSDGGQVRVLFFSGAREACGLAEAMVACPSGMRIGDLLEELVRRHAGLAPLRGQVRLARNGEFARMDEGVFPGDEVALIPPVSGG
ncbi:MAG TPA: MoaD/ThiS family protein [Verrucomicrobiae bacterium]|nr:MoaD/ThiS family protein [Verrucomicrobiae bacterium]